MSAHLSAEELRSLIRLEGDVLYWLPRDEVADPQARKFNKHFAGKPVYVRKDSRGYHIIRIFGRVHSVHRVVWALHHGSWPTKVIDHINRVKTDNRIENLRDVTHSENNRNKGLAERQEAVGTVFVNKGRWRADVRVHGLRIALGTFDTEAEARAARFAGAKTLTSLGLFNPERPTSHRKASV